MFPRNQAPSTVTHSNPLNIMNANLQHLTAQLAEWQSLQPLKREDNDRLWRKLRLDWNYHSNHLEGNTLTYGETEILLIHGQATGDHGLRDYMEMKAHDVAIDHMRQLVEDDRPLTEVDIRDFNRILIKESFWKDAITPDGQPSRIEIVPGEYKKQPNNVRTASGEIFRFADPVDVPIKMHELVEWLRGEMERKELHPIEIAAKLHHDFVLIHPFGDGNGRTARILVNYVLMRSGYLPLVVPTQQKDRYLAALRRADAGNLQALTDYLGSCLEASMNRGIAAAKGESIEEPDDLAKEIELFKRRQKGDEMTVERRSKDSMLSLYNTSLRPLFVEVVDTLGTLNSLFHGVEEKLTIPNPGVPAISTVVTNLADGGDKVAAAKKIHYHYNLKGYKGVAPHPFEVKTQITVEFSEYHYTIDVGSRSGDKRRYGQTIKDNERRDLCQEALRQAFAEIKNQSGEV